MADTNLLPHVAAGPEDGVPIVLLHGFGGDRLAWAAVQPRLAERHRTIAFDLPGHGLAVERPEVGNAAVAAKAVVASLDALGIERGHLVGHSMGGAVALFIALRHPGRVASLTLIAPGGVGRELNGRLLRRFAAMTSEHDIALIFENFLGFAKPMPDGLVPLIAEVRADPALIRSYIAIVETLIDGDGQKTLSVADLAAAPFPVKVIWGDQDHVIPCAQAALFPPNVARHVLPGVGHLPLVVEEALRVKLILVAVAAAAAAAR
jgi:pyruvate dehydrogenase E2 component (dihydrolipoamide acetyltransferase)